MRAHFVAISASVPPSFAGLIAVTYPFDGAFTDGDNINGDSGHVTRDGMVYVVSAGQGVCHQEYTVEEGTHHMIQTIFRIPKDKLAVWSPGPSEPRPKEGGG